MEHPAVRDVGYSRSLGRDEVDLNVEEISGYLKNKTVLVTGGGGSIGSGALPSDCALPSKAPDYL